MYKTVASSPPPVFGRAALTASIIANWVFPADASPESSTIPPPRSNPFPNKESINGHPVLKCSVEAASFAMVDAAGWACAIGMPCCPVLLSIQLFVAHRSTAAETDEGRGGEYEFVSTKLLNRCSRLGLALVLNMGITNG
jgi:hypothetical protein